MRSGDRLSALRSLLRREYFPTGSARAPTREAMGAGPGWLRHSGARGRRRKPKAESPSIRAKEVAEAGACSGAMLVTMKGDAMAVESKPRPKIIERARTGKRGQPPYEPSDENRAMVQGMVGLGIRRADLAALMAITQKTLRKHFRKELEVGDAMVVYTVGKSLYLAATTAHKGHPHGNVAAQMFFLRCRAGWKETSRHEMTGPDGEPIAHAYEIKDLDKLPVAELARLYKQAVAAPDRG